MGQIETPTWSKIVIHHSAIQDDEALAWQSLWNYHVLVRGWEDIGYHFLVDSVNGDYVALVGRPEDQIGAHVKGYNQSAIGICCVGDYSKESPRLEMLEVLVNRLLRPIMQRYDLGPGDVLFHRDLWATECPGKYFKKEMLLDVLKRA